MKYTPRLVLVLLSLTAVPALNGASAATALTQQLARCAALGSDDARLACYDELARTTASNISQSRHVDFIQPPVTLLDSRLVTEAWKADYTLTLRGLVDLLAKAVMENKQRVTIQGWSRENRDYVLHLTMSTPVELHFLPRESSEASMPMSLLREVVMDGHTLDAGQFILITAAMVPDETTDDTRAPRLPDSQ